MEGVGSQLHFALYPPPVHIASQTGLPELIASFDPLGYDVVEMVLADHGWDRYEAAKWLTMRRWLDANPADELVEEVRTMLHSEPKRYAAYSREYLGWGVFALMARVIREGTSPSG